MALHMIPFRKKPVDPDSRKNEEIEKQLRADRKRQEREVKLLLLGAGESGKSTVLKQMRIIYTGGFTQNERKQWRVVIFSNLVDAFRILLTAMEDHNTYFENEENHRCAELIQTNPDINPEEPLPIQYLDAFTSLWEDCGVKTAILKGNEYALHDNLSYFFDDIEHLFDRDYLPSNQDILRTRLRTTGVSESTFDIGGYIYRMVDVGGQRSERRKWIHAFDNVQAVLFLAAISGYDQALVEDRKGNQMHEALMLFQKITETKCLRRSSLILFLNKIDLFQEKLSSGMSPICKWFPEYPDENNDILAAQEFFAQKFKSCLGKPARNMYVHYTTATDTDLLKKTMESVRDMIIKKDLQNLVIT